MYEIKHGEFLAGGCPEDIWGWGTPAGKLRAERRAALIARGAGLAPGLNVLEVGCGTGNFTEKFARSGAQILACDISPDLIEKAKARNLPERQVRFLCSRFEDDQIEPNFDAVVGSSILHHLELEDALPKMLNLLKPSGAFCFAEPNLLNPQVFIMLRFRQFFPQVSRDETAMIRFPFKRTLEKVGFTKVDITPFDWLHPSVPPAFISMVQRVGKMLEHLPVVREFSGSLLITARKKNS